MQHSKLNMIIDSNGKMQTTVLLMLQILSVKL